jgi:methylenetetrahydrofolate--tRNA-(uracil-5-)-methyltransferase
VFGLIPGLERAEFVRYGIMHRNTFINSPKLLNSSYRFKSKPYLYFAGQITGVEGYVESASSGLVAGICAARQFLGQLPVSFPSSTASGALCNYISNESVKDFQPMNINFGIMEGLKTKIRDKRLKNHEIAMRALEVIKSILDGI